jgi:hypothetical protein
MEQILSVMLIVPSAKLYVVIQPHWVLLWALAMALVKMVLLVVLRAAVGEQAGLNVLFSLIVLAIFILEIQMAVVMLKPWDKIKAISRNLFLIVAIYRQLNRNTNQLLISQFVVCGKRVL